MVIGERAGKCIYDPQCVKNTANPNGIPIWKIFDMNYFPTLDWHGTPTDATPLGGPWIISTVDNGPEYPWQYVGYVDFMIMRWAQLRSPADSQLKRAAKPTPCYQSSYGRTASTFS